MFPEVLEFIDVEMIRDGGSYALKFGSPEGGRYILFTKIRVAHVGPEKKDDIGYYQEIDWVGHEEPFIVNCDPAKRPQDTKNRIYSELSGPAIAISWDEARQIIGRAGSLARDLSPIREGWLNEMKAIIEGDGHPPAGSQTRRIGRRGALKKTEQERKS